MKKVKNKKSNKVKKAPLSSAWDQRHEQMHRELELKCYKRHKKVWQQWLAKLSFKVNPLNLNQLYQSVESACRLSNMNQEVLRHTWCQQIKTNQGDSLEKLTGLLQYQQTGFWPAWLEYQEQMGSLMYEHVKQLKNQTPSGLNEQRESAPWWICQLYMQCYYCFSGLWFICYEPRNHYWCAMLFKHQNPRDQTHTWFNQANQTSTFAVSQVGSYQQQINQQLTNGQMIQGNDHLYASLLLTGCGPWLCAFAPQQSDVHEKAWVPSTWSMKTMISTGASMIEFAPFALGFKWLAYTQNNKLSNQTLINGYPQSALVKYHRGQLQEEALLQNYLDPRWYHQAPCVKAEVWAEQGIIKSMPVVVDEKLIENLLEQSVWLTHTPNAWVEHPMIFTFQRLVQQQIIKKQALITQWMLLGVTPCIWIINDQGIKQDPCVGRDKKYHMIDYLQVDSNVSLDQRLNWGALRVEQTMQQLSKRLKVKHVAPSTLSAYDTLRRNMRQCQDSMDNQSVKTNWQHFKAIEKENQSSVASGWPNKVMLMPYMEQSVYNNQDPWDQWVKTEHCALWLQELNEKIKNPWLIKQLSRVKEQLVNSQINEQEKSHALKCFYWIWVFNDAPKIFKRIEQRHQSDPEQQDQWQMQWDDTRGEEKINQLAKYFDQLSCNHGPYCPSVLTFNGFGLLSKVQYVKVSGAQSMAYTQVARGPSIYELNYEKKISKLNFNYFMAQLRQRSQHWLDQKGFGVQNMTLMMQKYHQQILAVVLRGKNAESVDIKTCQIQQENNRQYQAMIEQLAKNSNEIKWIYQVKNALKIPNDKENVESIEKNKIDFL